MSDSEDDNYVSFGDALDPLDEENLPRKKPVTIEDQYAYDAQGRRRFHGAFTGGFSAGYFNTVGTRDGWTPQQFKSSRSNKAENVMQRPEDFMDDEDTGQFGIAPKGIRTVGDYTDHVQRGTKRERFHNEDNRPIPGVPVLKELFKPVNCRETVGIMLLKKMGWKPGQGVGCRLTKKQKAKMQRHNERVRMLGTMQKQGGSLDNSSEGSEDEMDNVTFAPDDYEPFRCNPKDNFFGIGYQGLERKNILSNHINLFDAPAFSLQEKNKRLLIHGQAFGVGAFEVDDEDIYAKEDMSSYDFSLGPERKEKSRWSESSSKGQCGSCVDGFTYAKRQFKNKKLFAPPELPADFVPVHAIRKSRFYPPIENDTTLSENRRQKKELLATDRARILNDNHASSAPEILNRNCDTTVISGIISRNLNLHDKEKAQGRLTALKSNETPQWMDKLNANNFIKAEVGKLSDLSQHTATEATDRENSGSIPKNDSHHASDNDAIQKQVQTYFSDSDKQRRFQQYLALIKTEEKIELEKIQPLSMTEWEREQEYNEFEQAAKLFKLKPMAEELAPTVESTIESVGPKDQVKQAVKMKMFGKLTRERMEWKPASIVCKRFNVPEPDIGCMSTASQKKSTKYSIFDGLDSSTSLKFHKASNTALSETDLLSANEKQPQVQLLPVTSTAGTTLATVKAEIAVQEPVSEKMKNFEATYKKVFGKGVDKRLPHESVNPESNQSSECSEVGVNVRVHNENSSSTDNEVNRLPKSSTREECEEKKDLFKAIFLSSSEESESEPEDNVDTEALRSVLIGKIPSEVNSERNTSPPRGIFANVDLHNLINNSTPSKKQDAEHSPNMKQTVNLEKTMVGLTGENGKCKNTDVMDTSILPDMYGPALPARLTQTSFTGEESKEKIPKAIFRSVVVSTTSSNSKSLGKWVERRKLKKSKKEKKKHKHKEHKSAKHKRKSKKERR